MTFQDTPRGVGHFWLGTDFLFVTPDLTHSIFFGYHINFQHSTASWCYLKVSNHCFAGLKYKRIIGIKPRGYLIPEIMN